MRFARLRSEGGGLPAGLEDLAGAGELDLLQLDFPRPRLSTVAGRAPAELPESAVGFAEALRALVKTLYLEPQLHLIASAGWANAYGCVERAAGVLVEGGCGDLPVAAVRGSNLLPILEMLVAEGVDLRNAKTGAPWRELREPILAADLELGAGPLVSALAEKARVIVAGCFDAASPATAFAVAEFGWSWSDFDRLAASALAARAATWRDWSADQGNQRRELWQPPRADLDDAGNCTVETADGDDAAAPRLQEWLRSGETTSATTLHADVRLDLSAVNCELIGPRQISVKGASGTETDGDWRLEVLYQTGYAAEAMVEFDLTTDTRRRRQIVEIARAHLQLAEDASGLLTVEELQPLSDAGGVGWLHLAYQSKSRTACQHFADQTVRLVSAHRPHVRLAAGAPAVHVHCRSWPARVPRDAIDIAVETRLAKEWI